MNIRWMYHFLEKFSNIGELSKSEDTIFENNAELEKKI